MKIVSIKFLNLNSLKGEHEIRFDRSPFTESGLFAITGPTGAGKTTILDAITAALYGNVHRQKDVCDIMTRHTGEAYSEVEFEAREKMYRAKWSVKRSRGKAEGNLQAQKMELVDASSNTPIITHPLKEVKDAIAGLCGLDYNQFLRSVMLCQGDFTRFLKADENERSELLEKITDTEIYSQISIFTFDKTKEEKTKLDVLRNNLQGVSLLTEDELQTFNTNLFKASSLALEKAGERKTLETHVLWLQNIYRLNSKKHDLQNTFEIFIADYESKQPLFDKLTKHQQAVKHLPLLTETEGSARQVDEIKKKLEEISLRLPGLEHAAVSLSTQLQVAEEAYKAAEHLQNENSPVITETEKKDILIETKAALCKKEETDYHDASVAVTKIREDTFKKQEDLERLKSEISELEKWLLDHEREAELEKLIPVLVGYMDRLDDLNKGIGIARKEKARYEQQEVGENENLRRLKENARQIEPQIEAAKRQSEQYHAQLISTLENKSLEEWETQAGNLPSLISVYEQQLSIAKQLQQSADKIASLDSRQKTLAEKAIAEAGLLSRMKDEHSQAGEHLSALERNVELQMLIQKYEADRLRLQPEQECPLCGSTHHPFVETRYASDRTEAEQKRDSQKQKTQWLLKQINDKIVFIGGLEHDLEYARKQKEETIAGQLVLLQNFHANNANLPNVLDEKEPAIIQALIVKKQIEQQLLKDKIQVVRSLLGEIKKSETAFTKFNESLLKNNGEIRQAEARLESIRSFIIHFQNELDSLSVNEADITGKSIQLLVPYQILFSYTSAGKALQQLKHRSVGFRQKQKDLLDRQLAFNQTKSDIEHAAERIREKSTQLRQLEEQLNAHESELAKLREERFHLFGEKDTVQERKYLETELARCRTLFENTGIEQREKKQALAIARNQQVDLASDLRNSEENYQKLISNLNKQLSSDNIESVASLKQRFIGKNEAEQIEQQQRESEKIRTQLERSLFDTNEELTKEIARELTIETKEVLSGKIAELESETSKLNQEIGSIGQALKEDEKRKGQYREIALRIELQQKEYDRWNKLCLLIGSENGKKFSRFAQGLTLARLTELANRHLLRLSDRYMILKAPEKDLELQIIDGYQADVVRPMATLSGGESFLVSLALALGLSDLASRKVQINSLFIDEGFGTLDAETLDVAISALENLQANGKSIGIISHVDALKERIGTQIQISKQPGGSSKIRLVSYASEVVEV